MPRGKKIERVYTGNAAKINEKVEKLTSDLAAAKEELKAAYAQQLKDEKKAAKKMELENQRKLKKALLKSGLSAEEIIEKLGIEAE